jgi:hypothetical protein
MPSAASVALSSAPPGCVVVVARESASMACYGCWESELPKAENDLYIDRLLRAAMRVCAVRA